MSAGDRTGRSLAFMPIFMPIFTVVDGAVEDLGPDVVVADRPDPFLAMTIPSVPKTRGA